MSRRLKLSIFRHNPRDPKSVPRLVDYELDEQPGMTLFIALNAIRDTQAPDLNFDFVCRAGVCGSCAMVIDGRPRAGLPYADEHLAGIVQLVSPAGVPAGGRSFGGCGELDARTRRAPADLGPPGWRARS